jgi:hypothetical protein
MTRVSGCSESADRGFSRQLHDACWCQLTLFARELGSGKSIQIKSPYSVRKALMGSTLAARPAGNALAARATIATPATARR